MKIKLLPTQQRLKQLINYDPQSGDVTWLPRGVSRWDTKYAGKLAGGQVGQYKWISIENKNYLLHRVIFKWMTGREPSLIDHKDGNKLNNVWTNLREADSSQNRCNSPVTLRSLSGVKGVRQGKTGKWQGIVNVRGEAHRTARFDTLEEAREATDILRASLHGSFARS